MIVNQNLYFVPYIMYKNSKVHYELRDSVVISPFLVSEDASDIDPASEEDMIREVSPFAEVPLKPLTPLFPPLGPVLDFRCLG